MTTPTYRALLVANSTFPDDRHHLAELEGPRNDAALLRDALCDREYGLFAGDNVRLVQERRMSEVLREVEDFLRSATRDDTLLLYYSGHGVLDQSNELFLCAHDSRTDRLRSTAIKASDVSHMIDESAARRTIILLDCCHSGRFKGGDVTARLGGEGRFVLTSSRSAELARDALAPNRASLFTNHLVEGLMGKARDHDDDGVVNLSELYDYVHEEMRTAGSHVPQKRFEGTGDVPVALRPASSGHGEVDVIDPAAAAPLLDLSTTEIDLGDITDGEALPPERILVINRGGGTLDWTVTVSDAWVTATPDAHGIELHLRPPGAGIHRANVYVTDHVTGNLRTVRVRVRVSAATGQVTAGERRRAFGRRRVDDAPGSLPPPGVPPVPSGSAPAQERPVADVPAASALADVPPASMNPPTRQDAGPADVPPPGAAPTRGRADWSDRVAIAAAVLAAVGGVSAAMTGWDLGWEAHDSSSDQGLWWRGDDWGPGVSESIVAGALLAIIAMGVWSRRWRPAVAAAVTVGALTTMTLRVAEGGQLREGWNWLDAWASFDEPVYLLVLAVVAGVLAVAWRWGRGVVGRPRRIDRGGAIALAATVVWIVGLGSTLYDATDEGYRIGNHMGERGDGQPWQVVTALIVLAVIAAALTVLHEPVARGALVGATIVPLASAVAEVGFVVDGVEPVDWGWQFVLFVAASVTSTGAALRIAVRGFGPRTANATDQVLAISTSS